MKSSLLPPNFVKCLHPSVRKELGVLTPEEALSKSEVKSERDLQRQIIALLNLKGICPIWHATHKRSTATVGTPDIIFAVDQEEILKIGCRATTQIIAHPVGWEVKLPGQSLSTAQQQLWVRLSTPPNCWWLKIIHSIDEAIAELRLLGIT